MEIYQELSCENNTCEEYLITKDLLSTKRIRTILYYKILIDLYQEDLNIVALFRAFKIGFILCHKYYKSIEMEKASCPITSQE